jgi:isopenicillin N synthase-like dioxygenase
MIADLQMLDMRLLDGTLDDQQTFRTALREACRTPGYFYLINPPISPALCDRILDAGRIFFALDSTTKHAINIKHSPHFRGYSEMKNSRDWREQLHFGVERPARSGERCYQLQGPNLWPESLGETWKAILLAYLDAAHQTGMTLLAQLAISIGLPESYFAALSADSPYLVMKLIHYHPQAAETPLRQGVAPHYDWSWLTLLLQDNVGGLQAQYDGEWHDMTPVPYSLCVHLGELLELASGGYFHATPHRVINVQTTRSRLSLPTFINPPLDATITDMPLSPIFRVEQSSIIDEPHVHRVADPAIKHTPFNFGESEWKRKGEGYWCYRSSCRGEG